MSDGDYLLLLEVDAADAVAEENEDNNVAVSATRFATAADLAPSALIGPPAAGPGDAISLNLTIDNLALPVTTAVDVVLKISTDAINDVTDPILTTDTVNLSGAASETFAIATTVPTNVANGLYFAIVVVDPDDQVDETNNGNNVYVGTEAIRVGPDFVVTDVLEPPGGIPGETVTVTTNLSSIGSAYIGPLQYALHLSADGQLDAQDTLLGTFTVSVAGERCCGRAIDRPSSFGRRRPSFHCSCRSRGAHRGGRRRQQRVRRPDRSRVRGGVIALVPVVRPG